MRHLLLALCLLFSVSVFAQEKSLDQENSLVQDSALAQESSSPVFEERISVLDSIPHYQNLLEEAKIGAITKRMTGYPVLVLGVGCLLGGGYLMNQISMAGGAGYAIGIGVLPIGLFSGGIALTIAGWSTVKAGSRRSELAIGYENRLKSLKEQLQQLDEAGLLGLAPEEKEVLAVHEEYLKTLDDGHFRNLKNRERCRSKTDVAGFYGCVADLYSDASVQTFIVGGVIIAGGTFASIYTYNNFKEKNRLVLWGIGTAGVAAMGVADIVYGGIFRSMATKYRNMAGNQVGEKSLANLMVAPIVDPVNGNYGGALAFNF